MKTIDSFSGDYRFLSNFWPSRVSMDSLTFPTVEHAFQAAKTLDLFQRQMIRDVPLPGQAKHLGRAVILRQDWESIKLDVMYGLLKQKFSAKNLKGFLLDTGDIELIEGNTWGDKFWGTVDGEGQNHLGKLLMQVRSELK